VGLITACRVTIHELGLTVRIHWEDRNFTRIDVDIGEVLDNLPNLITFGTALGDSPPLPLLSENPTWSLLLFHIPKAFESHLFTSPGRMVVEYGIRKVIFDNTWQDIRVAMDNAKSNVSVLKRFWSTLDTMEKGAVLVCDINGIPSTESYGRGFRSWLSSRYEMALELVDVEDNDYSRPRHFLPMPAMGPTSVSWI
jgi:hypothetical protein